MSTGLDLRTFLVALGDLLFLEALLLVGFLLVLSVLAVIGEYVMRNFLMTQRYPGYVVRVLHRKDPESDG